MPAGVDANGLTIKTLEEIQDEMIADEQALISPAIDTNPDQILGQLNGIQASKLAELWEGLQTAYNAFNPNAAEGYLLDVIGALRGIPRVGATASYVILSVNGTAGTVLPAGVATANVAGQSTNRWAIKNTFVFPSTGIFFQTFVAVTTGPITAAIGTITEITTPIAGWTSVYNTGSAVLGSASESDAAYRLRQASLLAAPGASTIDSIRSDVSALEGMKQVAVFENTTDSIDVDGRPPHSFEVVFRDDGLVANTDVAQAIWNSKPAGIATYGSASGNATDSTGALRNINFSRAAAVSLDVEAFGLRALPGWTVAQVPIIRQTVVDYLQSLKVGQDVSVNRIRTIIMQNPFVWDVATVRLGGSGGITLGDYPITFRQYAQIGFYDLGGVTILPGIP